MTEMAKGDWWFKFEIPAWRNSPELRKCSLETRGFWIECIAIMKDTGMATITGTYQDLARAVGCFPDEAERCIGELRRNKTADVTLRNDTVTVKSRKYARELKAKELTRLRVQRHRDNADVTPKKRVSVKSKSNKKETREEKESGKPPLREIFFGTVEAGLAKRMGIKSLPNQREWHEKFAWAFANDFTTEAAFEAYDLMKKGFWKDKSVSAKSWADSLANLETLRVETKANGNGSDSRPKGPTQREAIAAEQARIDAELAQETGGVH